ncbi:MAG TPA: hypothetical protein VIB79_07915 [Candidatus Binatia bacterium]
MALGFIRAGTSRSAPRLTKMREFTRHRLSFCFLVAALAFLVFRALQLALIKNFSIDELTYAHAAWLISTGKQPFRDFFFHHFPFSLQLGSLVFTGFGDSPTAIILLRKLMIPFWAATAATVFMLNRCRGWLAALTGAIFLLSTGVYLDFATEFRPESVATPLFLLALLFTSSDTARWSRLRSLASGAALILAVWSSEKALFYGIIFSSLSLQTYFGLADHFCLRGRTTLFWAQPYFANDWCVFDGDGKLVAVVALGLHMGL